MTIRDIFATRSGALKARIQTVEHRIQRRRDNISVAMDSIAHNARSQLISPATLIAAGLFGAALHRSHQLNGLRMLAILQTANAGLRLLLTATSKTSDTPK